MSASENYPDQFSPDEVKRLQQYLDMGSAEVATTSDADVEYCLNLLSGAPRVSSETEPTNGQPNNAQHRFRTPRFVGKGSFGIVFLVFDQTLGMDVAIKLLRPSKNSRVVQQRFLEEARITAHLTHPNIIRMYDSGFVDEIPYITCTIANDGSLADHIARYPGGMPPLLACRVLCQVAEAVAYAHSRLTYHRDIKPSNILMIAPPAGSSSAGSPSAGSPSAGSSSAGSSSAGSSVDDTSDISAMSKPVLTDFGLAKRWDKSSDALTIEGDILGTARYMSPEQACGDLDQYSVKSEVFTLGIILFEMLTGTIPFRGQSSTEVRRSIVQDRPLALRALRKNSSKDLGAILAKCLEKSPEHRYESVAMLVKDLQRFLAGEPVEASQPSLVRMAFWQAKQHPWLAGSFTVTCLTICLSIVGVSYAWWRQYHSSLREHQTKVDYVNSLGKLADDVFAGEKDQQAVMLETLQAFEDKLKGDLAADLGNQKLRHLLSVVQHYKSTVLSRSGKIEESMLCRIDSLINLKILRDRNPTNATYRFQFLFGVATMSEVMFHSPLSRVRPKLASVVGAADANAYARLLIKELDQFTRDFDVPTYSEACNSFRVQSAQILLLDEPGLAEEQLELAIRNSKELADKHPESPAHIKGALSGLWVLAGDANMRDDDDAVEKYASQANAIFEKYLRPHFDEDWVRAEFAIRQTWYATWLCQRGRYEKACQVAEETYLVNQEHLNIDATRTGAQLRDFKLIAIQYKSLIELGRQREAEAFYMQLKASTALVRQPEFVRLDSFNLATTIKLPDEILSLLSAVSDADRQDAIR